MLNEIATGASLRAVDQADVRDGSSNAAVMTEAGLMNELARSSSVILAKVPKPQAAPLLQPNEEEMAMIRAREARK